MFEDKAWGRVQHVFGNPNCAVSVLHTLPGGFCSRHYHKERVNRFVVVTGALDVVHWNADATVEESRVKLAPGEIHDVPANAVHSFEVVEEGIVVEVYWPSATVRQDDIERIQLGGMK